MKNDSVINQCQLWVEEFIVANGICPFAAPVVAKNDVSYHVIESEDPVEALTSIMLEVQQAKSNNSPETILFILPAWQADFEAFLDLSDFARNVLQQYDLDDVFQFANFHPEYLFQDEPIESSSHFTNRSPWPMLHLIRQDSISVALENYPNPENIPTNNIRRMEELGTDSLKAQLLKIQHDKL